MDPFDLDDNTWTVNFMTPFALPASLTYTPPLKCFVTQRPTDLRLFPTTTDHNIHAHYLQVSPVEWRNYGEYSSADLSTTQSNKLILVEGAFKENKEQVSYVVFAVGDPDIMFHPMAKLPGPPHTSLASPVAMWDAHGRKDHPDPGLSAIVIQDTEFYRIKSADLPKFWSDNGPKLQAKILSTLYLTFKHMTAWIDSIAVGLKYTGSTRPATSDPTAESHRVMACVALGVLGPAFSQVSKLGPQIHRRANAGAASKGIECPPEGVFSAVVSTADWVPGSITSLIHEAMGRVVAIDTDGEYNRLLATDELMTEDEYADTFRAPDWTRAMFSQARMVYARHGITSLHFGFDVMDLLKDLLPALGGAWKMDYEALLKSAAKYRDRPYAGCQRTTPPDQTVATQVRPVYIGLLYHSANIKEKEDQDNFKDYAVERVGAHITSAHDKDLCKYIASTLPGRDLTNLAEMSKTVSAPMIQSMLTSQTEEFKEKLYAVCAVKAKDGDWYKTVRQKREAIQTAALLDAFNLKVSAKFDETSRSITSMIMSEPDPAKRMELTNWNTTLRSEYSALKSEVIPLGKTLPEAKSMDLEDLRDQLIAKLEPLYKLAGACTPIDIPYLLQTGKFCPPGQAPTASAAPPPPPNPQAHKAPQKGSGPPKGKP